MSIQKKIVISLLILLICLLWWRTVFYGQKSGFKEIAVADGQTSFTADFDTISSIVVSNNDRKLMNRTEHELLAFTDYTDLQAHYEACQKISFDYAVGEHETSIGVVRYAGQWKDIGSWNTFAEEMHAAIGGTA